MLPLPVYFESPDGGVYRCDCGWSPRAVGAAFRARNDSESFRAESVTVHMGRSTAVLVAVYAGEPRAFKVRRGAM